MMNEELIVVKQLPVIEQKLQSVKEAVTAKTELALGMVCCEDTVKEIKAMRAELKKDLTFWENKRKEVKALIAAPYEKFEEVYKECISDIFKAADTQLKEKIDAVEDEVKLRKSEKIKEYFYECRGMDERLSFLTYEMADINVTLSASEKSLKTKAKEFVKKVVGDIELIETQDHKSEILYEYKQSLNISDAVTKVVERHKAMEEQEAKSDETAAVQKQENDTAVPVMTDVLSAPKCDEVVYTVAFKVTATAEKIKALKTFLIQGGYKYE